MQRFNKKTTSYQLVIVPFKTNLPALLLSRIYHLFSLVIKETNEANRLFYYHVSLRHDTNKRHKTYLCLFVCCDIVTVRKQMKGIYVPEIGRILYSYFLHLTEKMLVKIILFLVSQIGSEEMCNLNDEFEELNTVRECKRNFSAATSEIYTDHRNEFRLSLTHPKKRKKKKKISRKSKMQNCA